MFRNKLVMTLAALCCALAQPVVAQTSVYSLPGAPAEYEVTYNGPSGVTFRHKATGSIYGFPQGVFRFSSNVWKAEGKVLVPQFVMPSTTAPSPADIAAAEARGYGRAKAEILSFGQAMK